MNEVLHLPPWMNEWMVSEAKRCGIDAAVHADAARQPPVAVRHAADRDALRAAGVPVLMLDADMVDATDWNRESAVDQVAAFLRTEVKR